MREAVSDVGGDRPLPLETLTPRGARNSSNNILPGWVFMLLRVVIGGSLSVRSNVQGSTVQRQKSELLRFWKRFRLSEFLTLHSTFPEVGYEVLIILDSRLKEFVSSSTSVLAT